MNALGLTIKHDNTNKVLTFLAFISTYTEEDQINIAFYSESSTGKSHIPIEISKLFPRDDVITFVHTSPTAFFYDSGKWDNDRQLTVIDLSNKIFIFSDQPHDQLLQRLRPILSHDEKILTIKITNKNRGKNEQMTAEIIGYPTVVFCSTTPSLDPQEKTRFLILSPEVTQEKLREAIYQTTEKNMNKSNWNTRLENDPWRKDLCKRIDSLKQSGIKQVIIPKELSENILSRFLDEHRSLIPRNMRDYQHLLRLIKSWAILNHSNRERKGDEIMAKAIDVEVGFQLFLEISESNELGLTPEIYGIFNTVIKPTIQKKGDADRKDLLQAYFNYYNKPIPIKRLDIVLLNLESVGLIESKKDYQDRRKTIYSLIQDFSNGI